MTTPSESTGAGDEQPPTSPTAEGPPVSPPQDRGSPSAEPTRPIATTVDGPVATAMDPPPPVAGPIPPPIYANRPQPAPREPRDPTALLPSWLIAGACAAVMTDVALRRVPWNNVAGALLIAVLAIGLLASGFIRTTGSRLMIAGSVFFGLFLALRTEPLLTTFNAVTACALLVLGAIHGQGRSFWDARPLRLLADTGVVIFEGVNGLVEVPAEVLARYQVFRDANRDREAGTAYALIRGLAMAVPVVLLFGVLLASADVVFSSFFRGFGTVNPGSLIGHLVLMAIGAYAMMVLIRMAAVQGATDPVKRSPSLGHIETGVILVSVNLLFAAFAIAQLMTVLGGAGESLDRAGLEPKQFARQGFFQLLWVAGLTLCLLMALHVATSDNQKARGITRALSLLTVALTILIVVVAFTRISYYIGDGGQTPLRLYSAVFSLWVALAFIVVAVRIQGVQAEKAWLLPALFLSGLVTLGILNVANPERIIALDNLNRDHDALRWHVVEGQFSGDGQAVLAQEMDRLSPERAEAVTTVLCQQYRSTDYRSGWLDFNLGKWRAENAVTERCR